MIGGLLRLLVFKMLPRRILPLLLLYDVYKMFRRRTGNQAGRRQAMGGGGRRGRPDQGLETGTGTVSGRSTGGSW